MLARGIVESTLMRTDSAKTGLAIGHTVTDELT